MGCVVSARVSGAVEVGGALLAVRLALACIYDGSRLNGKPLNEWKRKGEQVMLEPKSIEAHCYVYCEFCIEVRRQPVVK